MRRPAVLLAMLMLAGVSCADAPVDRTPPAPALVIGVLSNLQIPTDVARVTVEVSAGGRAVARDLAVPELAMPIEVRIDAATGAEVDVSVSGFEAPSPLSHEAPFLSRRARTQLVPGHLLRLRLDRECIPNVHLTGDLLGPTCAANETCVAARCADPWVPPADLESYAPGWAQDYLDACRTDASAEPSLQIGAGQSAFEPVEADAELQMASGLQGGYHVWVSLRAHQLHASGVTTTIEGRAIDLELPLETYRVAQSYLPGASGACELVGFRYEMPAAFWNGMIGSLLGQRVLLTARAVDESGRVTIATLSARFSSDVIKQQVE